MEKYTIGSIILISLSLVRFVFNGLSFLDAFNLRIFLFIFLYTAAILGMLFSKRWSYLLTAGTAISEFSIITVTSSEFYVLGALVTNALLVAFSVWMFYKMGKGRKR